MGNDEAKNLKGWHYYRKSNAWKSQNPEGGDIMNSNDKW